MGPTQWRKRPNYCSSSCVTISFVAVHATLHRSRPTCYELKAAKRRSYTWKRWWIADHCWHDQRASTNDDYQLKTPSAIRQHESSLQPASLIPLQTSILSTIHIPFQPQLNHLLFRSPAPAAASMSAARASLSTKRPQASTSTSRRRPSSLLANHLCIGWSVDGAVAVARSWAARLETVSGVWV